MDRQTFQRIIMTWKQGVPARAYDETCAFWAENGTFTVYRAAGNPGDWGDKVVRKGPDGARELFSSFHDECTTSRYDVSLVTIDVQGRRAAWRVEFAGERADELIRQELAFLIQLDEQGKISEAFIWPGNP